MAKFTNDRHCFVCGQENHAGLRLEFRRGGTPGEMETEVVFPQHLQGWQDTVHGGLLATVLDEVMVQAALSSGVTCVTAEITVAYKKPAATDTRYVAAGRVTETRGRILKAEGAIQDAAGVVYASAVAKLFRIEG